MEKITPVLHTLVSSELAITITTQERDFGVCIVIL